jgi:hypothetical protein
MLYEEAVGLKNAKRISWAGFTFLGFNISLMMVMWMSFAGQSRHLSLSEDQNANISQFLEDRFSALYDVMSGDGPKNLNQKSYVGMVPK